MSALVLKMIAEITMFGDHFAATLWDTVGTGWGRQLYWIIRSIARIAFPIFGFQLSEGVRHTSNKWKYLLRLCIFAVLSELFFDRALFGTWFDLYHQSVYVTLILGFFVMVIFQKTDEKEGAKKIPLIILAAVTSVMCAFFAEMIFYTDYGAGGVYMLSVFALNTLSLPNIRKDPKREMIFRVLVFAAAVAVLVRTTNSLETYAFLGVIPVAFYSGLRGNMSKKLRILFYAFYPLHLAVLSVVAMIMG